MFAYWPEEGSSTKIGRSFAMTSLLIGETSLGAVALRFEPSGAFAKVFAGEGAGVSGVDTEQPSIVVAITVTTQIAAVLRMQRLPIALSALYKEIVSAR